jgi:diamine N-acetyltransferase
MFKELESNIEIKRCHEVISKSFETVARELKLTKENAPTHPSFITLDKIKKSVKNGVKYIGIFSEKELLGCIAIEKSDTPGTFYIERFSVLPVYRKKGFGKALLDNAFLRIKELGGEKVSIAVINEHFYIKNYYLKYGFKETGIKTFRHLPFTVCFMEKKIIYEK